MNQKTEGGKEFKFFQKKTIGKKEEKRNVEK